MRFRFFTFARMRKPLGNAALGSLLAAFSASGQQAPVAPSVDIPVGRRVRVAAPKAFSTPHVGRFISADSLRVRLAITDNGTSVGVPWTDVTDLAWSRGTNEATGALRGLVVGLIGGTALYATQLGYARRAAEPEFSTGALALGTFFIVPSITALIGRLYGPERWESLSTPAGAATARATVEIHPRDKVRATTPDAVLVGHVDTSSSDSLTLAGRRLAWRDITSLDVRGGRNTRRGFVIGATVFLATSLIGESVDRTVDGAGRVATLTLAGVSGGLIGARYLGGKRWIEIPVPTP